MEVTYKKTTIDNMHRPPKTSIDNSNAFINEFLSITHSLENNVNNNIIMAGDFNLNLMKLNKHDTYNLFCTLKSHSLYL